jgi:hypothetical protein
VETAWHERRFSPTVDAFIDDGLKVGVRGVPAMGWPNRRAIVGLMPPTELVLRLRNERRNGYASDRCDNVPYHDVAKKPQRLQCGRAQPSANWKRLLTSTITGNDNRLSSHRLDFYQYW